MLLCVCLLVGGARLVITQAATQVFLWHCSISFIQEVG